MNRVFRFCAVASVVAFSAWGTCRGVVSDEKPLVSGIDLKCMDKNIRPQDDLFRFVNGSWLATAVIPADNPRSLVTDWPARRIWMAG